MRISFNVNLKGVLAVVAIGTLSVGSFIAGEHRQAQKTTPQTDSIAARFTPASIPVGKDYFDQIANMMAFCKTHPNSAFTSGTESDTCTSDGQVPDMATSAK